MNKNIINNAINKFISGNTNTGIKLLQKHIKKNPSDHLAFYNLGYFYQQLKCLELAKKNYLSAIEINPNHWESKINMSLICIGQQEYSTALKFIEDVLNIKKNYQPALRDRALILYHLNRYEEALNSIELSVNFNNKDYIALNTMGIIQLELLNLEIAKETFLKAIKLNNKYESSFVNLGRCFELLNLPEDSIKCFLEAEKLNPNSILTLNNIASYYVDQGNYNKGLEYYLKAYEKNSEDLMILSNLAKVYFYLNKYKLAEEFIQKCLKEDSKNEDYKEAYAALLFKQQKYSEAWDYYEGRLRLTKFSNKNLYANNIKKFLWDGRNINTGDKILVIKEQGIGDEILYGNIYADLFKKFPDAKIESDPKLIELFKTNFPLQKSNFFPFGFFSKNTSKLNIFDIVLYAGSLGKIFRQKLSNFSKKNLFFINNKDAKKIKYKLDAINNDYKIGISWKSFREKVSISKAKSIKLEDLSSINDLKKISLINIQYGNIKDEIMNFNNKYEKKIFTLDNIDIYNDLESLSNLLSQLDLFITISNSTAHLAGSLGVETWLITPPNHVSFHYWNQLEEHTPWYKNIKLYKSQTSIKKTILKIKRDLKKKYNL